MISCGNSIEQNGRIYKNAYHRLDRYRNNNNRHNNTRDNNNRDNDNRCKRQGNDKQSDRFDKNKRPKLRNSDEHVLWEKKDERRKRGGCIQCRQDDHFVKDCKVGWRSTTSTIDKRKHDIDNQKFDIKKTERRNERKAEVGNLRITKLGLEEENIDSENE